MKQGLAEIRSWDVPLAFQEFVVRLDIDAVVGGVLLVESVDELVGQGVPRSKLMKKVRDAREVDELWAVWAEIRAAAIAIGHPAIDLQIEFETATASGRRPDYRFVRPDGTHLWVEFKAVGLSNFELDWHKQAAERFDWLFPPDGLSNLHAYLDKPLTVGAAKRNKAWRQSASKAAELRSHGLAWGKARGIAVVGHATEDSYVRRAEASVMQAIKQLPDDEEAWVALWWGNGVPPSTAAQMLDAVAAPDNVTGLLLLGQAVAVPWSNISCFALPLHRGEGWSDYHVDSTVDDTLAKRVLERFESSSGVRPTQLRTPTNTTLLNRNGSRRLFPFNLLFDADPRVLALPHRPPSPVQDTGLIT